MHRRTQLLQRLLDSGRRSDLHGLQNAGLGDERGPPDERSPVRQSDGCLSADRELGARNKADFVSGRVDANLRVDRGTSRGAAGCVGGN